MTEIKKSICAICNPGTNCGLDLYVEDGVIVKAEGMQEHRNSGGALCAKGAAVRQYVYSPDRLKTPMKRVGEKGSGEFAEISWEEAFAAISEQFNGLKKEGRPESAAFFVGYPKWIRPFAQRLAYAYGTPNYCTESCTCFKAMYMAWKLTCGAIHGPDAANSRCFLIWGNNPFHSSPPMTDSIFDAKENGVKMIVADPRLTPLAEIADIHLRLRPGTDGALALGIANVIIREDLYDKEFAEKHMHGFDEYSEYVKTFPPGKAAEITGVPKDLIIRAARMYAGTKPASLVTSSSPIVHHTNGLQNARAVLLLSALTGNLGVKGGNIAREATWCEVPSGFPSRYLEYIAPLKPLSEMPPRAGSEKYPVWMELTHDAHGGALRQQILSGDPYPITHMMAFGLNHRMWPDSEYTLEALKKLDFFACSDIFLTDTCKYADILLPACTSVERSEIKSYGGGYVMYTLPAIEPLYDSKPDSDIVFELARRLDTCDELLKKGYEYNIDWIFEPAGLTVSELKKHPSGIVVPPEGIAVPPGGVIARSDAGRDEAIHKTTEHFKTPSGKVECVSEVIKSLQPSAAPLPCYTPPAMSAAALPELAEEYPFILNTGARLPMFLHSETFRLPWTRSLRPDPMADISAEDASALGVTQGDDIFITTSKGRIKVKANISDMALKGTVFMFHGYPEADVNSLISHDYLDPVSGFPGYKSLLCRIEKAGDDAPAVIARSDAGRDEAIHLFNIDEGRCVGCFTCVVACMDQNDIDPLAEDTPLFRFNQNLAKNCPVTREKKAINCDSCRRRAENGLPPACVAACPTKAMKNNQ